MKTSRCLIALFLLFSPLWGATEIDGKARTENLSELTPAAGPFLASGPQMFLSAEFLYWFSHVSNLTPYVKRVGVNQRSETNPQNVINRPLRAKDLNWSWDPGARVGLGAIFDRDGWDFVSEWTYFYNSASRSESVPPFTFVNALRIDQGDVALQSPWALDPNAFYTSVRAKYQLLFNQIDLALGRRFWVSPHLSLRPNFGVRGYWSFMHFHVKSNLRDATTTDPDILVFKNDRDRLRQSTWGVGLLLGLDSNWYFCPSWSFYTTGSLALVYGKANQKRVSSELGLDNQDRVRIDTSSSYFHPSYVMLPILDVGAGLQWETFFHAKKYHLTLSLGWESHFYIDYLYLERNYEDLPDSVVFSADGNLSISGGVLKGCFEF